MGKTVIFRLIDKTSHSWSIKDGTAMKDGTLKNTHYRPGVTSIFDEDNEKSAVQPQWVTLSYNNNPSDPACEIVVPEENKLLITFLKSLYHFGKVYKIHDAKGNAELKAANFDKISEALTLVDESDDLKRKAMAVAILGFDYFDKDPSFIKADLKEKAVKEATKIIEAFNAPDYQSKFLVSLAYVNGIVKNNDTNTAVVWANGEGLIISVAVGDNPINKMTELLGSGSAQAETLLQELGVRVNKSDKGETKNNDVDNGKELAAKDLELSEKDKQIEELKKQLAAKNEPKQETPAANVTAGSDNPGGSATEEVTDDKKTIEEKVEGNQNAKVEAPTLEELQEEYLSLSGSKMLPPNQKNDAVWLLKKINELKAQK